MDSGYIFFSAAKSISKTIVIIICGRYGDQTTRSSRPYIAYFVINIIIVVDNIFYYFIIHLLRGSAIPTYLVALEQKNTKRHRYDTLIQVLINYLYI